MKYQHLSNDELAVLRDAAVRITTIGTSLLDQRRLPVADWGMPVDTLVWLADGLNAEAEARGLLANGD